MVLAVHYNVSFSNVLTPRSRVGANIFLSENDSIPRWNGTLFAIAQIMKYVVSSAAEAKK